MRASQGRRPCEKVENGLSDRRHARLWRRSGPPLLERQTGLGAIERLDLALLIERQHDRVRLAGCGRSSTGFRTGFG